MRVRSRLFYQTNREIRFVALIFSSRERISDAINPGTVSSEESNEIVIGECTSFNGFDVNRILNVRESCVTVPGIISVLENTAPAVFS